MRHVPLLVALILGCAPASAQEVFELRFDHSTVLVSDLERSAEFYENILHLQPLESPFGPDEPILFYSLGGSGQLHVAQMEERPELDKRLHLALAVQNYDAYLRFLRDQGIAYSNFPGDSPGPQVRPDGVRQIYLEDPDGNWIEINDAAHSPK